MPVVVSVKFPFASRDLWFDPQGLDIVQGDYAICSTERGTEFGLVTADPHEVDASDLAAPLKPVLGIASDADLDRADELARRGESAMADFRELVEKNGLDMKPVGVEFLFGGEKAVFYFAAEDRVDFRQLVKDLSGRFRMRVDMRQIGVRDETRLVGGYAHCGQELCCTRFGGQFEPVSIRMAKEQDLPLNSAKISGVCGRLMCCLRYEFEAYKDFKSRAPKKKALIDTPLGRARIQEYDTPKEQLVLRLESGKVFRVNLADMTCSDECVKRAQEQNCACRPDTVTREVLDRIESPEMRLALMELDREMGVDVGDGLDRADRIASSSPTPRRKKQRDGGSRKAETAGGRAPSHGKARPAKDEDAAETPSSRRRRRRSDATAEQAEASDAQAQTSPSSRRRRRHLSAEERDEAFRSAAQRTQESGGRRRSAAAGEGASSSEQGQGQGRRRRHKQPSTPTRGESVKPDVPSVAEQVSTGEVRVSRRRPGDGGGARAAAPQPGTGREQAVPEDGEKKRRRRRRSRKPRTGGDEGQSSSAE